MPYSLTIDGWPHGTYETKEDAEEAKKEILDENRAKEEDHIIWIRRVEPTLVARIANVEVDE